MSLLTIVEQITTENGWQKPATVIANTDEVIVRILAHVNRAGKELIDLVDFISQKRVHSFNTVNGTAAYALPSDFLRFKIGTINDKTSQVAYNGPLSDEAWEAIASRGDTAAIDPTFKVIAATTTPFANQFNITPTPGGVETTQFRYMSNGWVKLNGNGARTTEFGLAADSANSSDSDVSLVDEELVKLWATWTFLETQGFPFAAAQDRAENRFSRYIARDGGTEVLGVVAPDFNESIFAAHTPFRGF